MLPTLKQQGVSVFILSEECDVGGIESLCDKIEQAGDQPLSPQLRASVSMKSPAIYIYTSGTTGDRFRLLHLQEDTKQTVFAPAVFSIVGLPKAAVITQEKMWNVSSLQNLVGVCSDDIIYVYLPLYHSSAFLMGLCGAIAEG